MSKLWLVERNWMRAPYQLEEVLQASLVEPRCYTNPTCCESFEEVCIRLRVRLLSREELIRVVLSRQLVLDPGRPIAVGDVVRRGYEARFKDYHGFFVNPFEMDSMASILMERFWRLRNIARGFESRSTGGQPHSHWLFAVTPHIPAS